MEATDPLAAFRAAPAEDVEDLALYLERQGLIPSEVYTKGGPPVALTSNAVFFMDDGVLYRVGREQVTRLGETRAADYRMMQWGVLLYLLALPAFWFHALLAGGLAILGGVLVTKGFLSKALLVQVNDDRIPPFVVDHRRWKQIGTHIQAWTDSPP